MNSLHGCSDRSRAELLTESDVVSVLTRLAICDVQPFGKIPIRFSVNSLTAFQSENAVLALDLQTMKTVDLGKDMKKISSRGYAFLDEGRVIGSPSEKLDEVGRYISSNTQLNQ